MGIILCTGVKAAAFLFFFLPMLGVVLSNTVLYILTVLSINYVSSVVESAKHKDRGRADLFIYIRLQSSRFMTARLLLVTGLSIPPPKITVLNSMQKHSHLRYPCCQKKNRVMI